MDTWLKGLVALACVAVIAAVAYWFWTERQAAQAAARRAEVMQTAALRASATKLQASGRCREVTSLLVDAAAKRPFATSGDVPTDLAMDAAVCARFPELLADFERTQLARLRIAELLTH